MVLFPAIDILEGRAVRLLYGRKDAVTDYGDPVDRAKMWADAGAEFLHVVDLSGAFGGESKIDRTLERIAKLGVPVQSGGGLRTEEDIRRRLDAGAARVVLGTVCAEKPDLFASALRRWGNKIVAGIDAKNGKLAVRGWTACAKKQAFVFGREARALGAEYAVYTDISRDGALSGVNLEETVKMADTGLKIIASGGIRDMGDLRALKEKGVYGAVLGRSVYTGAIDLAAAIAEMKHAE